MNKLIIYLMILMLVLLIMMFILKSPSQFILKEVSYHTLKLTKNDIKQRGRLFLKETVNHVKYTSDDFQEGMNVLIYGKVDQLEAEQLFGYLRRLN